MTNATVHFHSSDERFCGSTLPYRQFTLDPNDVTCAQCAAGDTFVLTEQGAAYVATLVSA
jgi:hypothetical protein